MRAVLMLAAIGLAACGHRDDRAAKRDATPAPPRAIAIDAAPPPADAAPPSSTYVGSATCKPCHEEEFAHWQASWHAKALMPGAKLAGPSAHFQGTSSEAWIDHARHTMKTTGPDGALATFPIDRVIGGKRMQDTITIFPDGRWQVLPIYFHVTGKAWVDYTESKQGALTPEHPFYWTNVRRMANHECLDCHTTGLRVSYDDTTRAWSTSYADMAVACEACHGPGSRHSASKKIEDIVQPKDAGALGVTACNRCHGPRKPLWPLLDPDHQFEPRRDGLAYDELYEPIVIALPEGLSSDFFADGKPKTSSFEYQALLQSACARKGGATCLTCHTAPHEAHRKDDLRLDANETCAGCHAAIVAQKANHSHHRGKQVDCIACHMPPIVSGVLDKLADHALDVPNPSAAHGVPDACSVCHPKKSADELERAAIAWWPQVEQRQARRRRLADAFDEATAKDSARALVAVIDDAEEAPTLRGAAMQIAARRFGAATAPTLLPLLASTDVVLRAKACEALGAARAGKLEVVTAAIARHVAAADEASVRVRLACALALWDLHDPRGQPALAELADGGATGHLAIPHRELGIAKAMRKDFAGARAELERAIALSPYAVDAIVALAEIDAELGDLAAARVRIEQALALEPHAKRALELRAKLPPAP